MSEPRNGNVALTRTKERPGRDPRLARAARDLLQALAARDQRAVVRAKGALRQALAAGGY
jgi:hypothetical protein